MINKNGLRSLASLRGFQPCGITARHLCKVVQKGNPPTATNSEGTQKTQQTQSKYKNKFNA